MKFIKDKYSKEQLPFLIEIEKFIYKIKSQGYYANELDIFKLIDYVTEVSTLNILPFDEDYDVIENLNIDFYEVCLWYYVNKETYLDESDYKIFVYENKKLKYKFKNVDECADYLKAYKKTIFRNLDLKHKTKSGKFKNLFFIEKETPIKAFYRTGIFYKTFNNIDECAKHFDVTKKRIRTALEPDFKPYNNGAMGDINLTYL